MTPAGIEPATFRFVAQHLNNCATVERYKLEIITQLLWTIVNTSYLDRNLYNVFLLRSFLMLSKYLGLQLCKVHNLRLHSFFSIHFPKLPLRLNSKLDSFHPVVCT